MRTTASTPPLGACLPVEDVAARDRVVARVHQRAFDFVLNRLDRKRRIGAVRGEHELDRVGDGVDVVVVVRVEGVRVGNPRLSAERHLDRVGDAGSVVDDGTAVAFDDLGNRRSGDRAGW